MFEIRVGVIGYVSVGKTTLINALFGEEYGEVSMRRTTAVVNAFRVGSKKASSGKETCMTDESSTMSCEDDDSLEIVTQKLSARATLHETTQDNKTFRNSNVVQEKTFDIALEEPLHKMRLDTKLVIVDVPGINEAGTSSKYKDYVNSNWHTFDIVVVVMDARQGVNTEEQCNLLKLVKENLSSSKKLPVIILENKVDDPDNKEQHALMDEARDAVTKIFEVNDRKEALDTILSGNSPRGDFVNAFLFPAVVPISAMHAFVYRCGSRLSFDEFKKMDDDFIEKIGKDYYGRQWNRFGKKQKKAKAYQAVSEEDHRKDGLEASNFDAFVKVLAYCIGDEVNQTILIRKQIDVALDRLKRIPSGCDLGTDLLSAQSNLKALGKPIDHLPGVFWSAFKTLRDAAYEDLKNNLAIKAFGAPMQQLHNYLRALSLLQYPGQAEEVSKNAKEVALQYAILLTDSEIFQNMSQNDQDLILGSMLLCSSQNVFAMNFGFLKISLETKRLALYVSPTPENHCYSKTCGGRKLQIDSYGAGTEYCGSCGQIWIERKTVDCPQCLRTGNGSYKLKLNQDGSKATCEGPCRKTFYIREASTIFCNLKFKVENGQLVPANKELHDDIVTVSVPESLEDSAHYGHVLWKCCQILQDVAAA